MRNHFNGPTDEIAETSASPYKLNNIIITRPYSDRTSDPGEYQLWQLEIKPAAFRFQEFITQSLISAGED